MQHTKPDPLVHARPQARDPSVPGNVEKVGSSTRSRRAFGVPLNGGVQRRGVRKGLPAFLSAPLARKGGVGGMLDPSIPRFLAPPGSWRKYEGKRI